jgi:hypothetical protein
VFNFLLQSVETARRREVAVSQIENFFRESDEKVIEMYQLIDAFRSRSSEMNFLNAGNGMSLRFCLQSMSACFAGLSLFMLIIL